MPPLTIANIALGILCALLLCASWIDAKSHRIPNWLVLVGSAVGIAINTTFPEGHGFTSYLPGALGFWKAMGGFFLGLVLLLPIYLLRAMGAGDVKLMAMVGAFLGPNAIIGATLLTFVTGGLLALIIAWRNGALQRLLQNMRAMLMNSMFKVMLRQTPAIEPAAVSAGKVPYAIAIATGTVAYFILARGGYLKCLQFF